MSRRTPRVRVTDAGIAMSSGTGHGYDVSFDGQRTWGFVLRPRHRTGWWLRVPWPTQLKPFLDGLSTVTIRRHDGVVVFDEEVRLGQGGDRIRIEDPEGRPMAVTKYGRMLVAFDSLDEQTKSYYLDQTEEVLGVLSEECGLPAYIAWGTLLGAVRTGHLIGHDVDVDLAWWSDHEAPVDVIRESFVVERALRRRGWTVRRENGGFLALFLRQADGSTRNMDVFASWRTDGWVHVVHDARAQLPRSAVVPLGTAVLEGRTMPAPADPPALLAAGYGDGWRVPDPDFAFSGDLPREHRMDGWLGGMRARRDAWGLVLRDAEPRPAPSDFARWSAERDPGEGDLLELGCGDGVDGMWFARDGRSVTAVEVVVVEARRVGNRARRQGLESFEATCLNLQDFRHVLWLGADWARRTRPTIYARGLLCDLPRPQLRDDVWRLARMALRDGGSLFLEVHTGRTRFGKDGTYVWCDGISPEEVRAAAVAHGATVVDEELVQGLDLPTTYRIHAQWGPVG